MRVGVAIGRIEVFNDFALVPDVIAGGNNVATQLKKVFSNGRSQPKAARCVFSIGNYQINFVGLNQVRHVVAHDFASSVAKNVTNEENLHTRAELLIVTFYGAQPSSAATEYSEGN